jgi:hypothetical protein
LSGQIINAISRQPVAAPRLLPSGVIGNSSGVFSLTGTGTKPAQRVSIDAAGYVTRDTTISAGTDHPVIDLIPASLESVYRELVRDGFQGTGQEPVRRWTEAPRFYVDTTPPPGVTILVADLDRIDAGIRLMVPALTGGRFHATEIVRGSQPPTMAGWIVIRFIREDDENYCGRALVGINPGWITFNYYRCTCGSVRLAPYIINHEIGHALGFWHVANEHALMYPQAPGHCKSADASQAERQAAQIAYTRAPGNAAPDSDPLGMSFVESARYVSD